MAVGALVPSLFLSLTVRHMITSLLAEAQVDSRSLID
jgi:hypothetical protein